MYPMCDDSTGELVGWAIGVADCDGTVTFDYIDEDGASVGPSLPAGWKACIQGLTGPAWSPGQSAITFASPTDIDFSDDELYRTLSINGNLTLTASAYQTGTELSIRITETGGSTRTVAYPSGWVWYTTKPTTIAANGSILLNLISYGTTAADVVARAWVKI